MWHAYLFQVITGNIGPQVHFDNAKWSISLNEIETASFQLRKSDIPRVDINYWLDPWWAGVLLMYDDVPVFAGPIIDRPDEQHDHIYVNCKGIRAIFEKRLVIQEQTNWDLLPKTVVQWKGLSLGTIAKKAVQLSMQKPSGGLPIYFPIADQTAANDADHQRTYKGFNIQNINCDDILTKLSDVSRGPDIMFRPKLLSDNQLGWDMVYGSEQNPRIPQKNTVVWDNTADQGGIASLRVITTGAYQTSRVFSSGAGTDAGTIVKVATNTGPLNKGYPLLETTIAISESENATVVLNHAKANLEANETELKEIQLSVRANGVNKLGTFQVGDEAILVVKGWLALKDGSHKIRILNINGDHTPDIKISVQTEV